MASRKGEGRGKREGGRETESGEEGRGGVGQDGKEELQIEMK
jgi:hypothetical protein